MRTATPIYGTEENGGPTKLCQALFRLPDDTSSTKPIAQPSCLATTGTAPSLTLVWNSDATWADVTAAMQDHAPPAIHQGTKANRGATGIAFSALNALGYNQDLAAIGDYKVTICSGRPRSDGNSYFIFGEAGDTTDTDEYCSWRNFGAGRPRRPRMPAARTTLSTWWLPLTIRSSRRSKACGLLSGCNPAGKWSLSPSCGPRPRLAAGHHAGYSNPLHDAYLPPPRRLRRHRQHQRRQIVTTWLSVGSASA